MIIPFELLLRLYAGCVDSGMCIFKEGYHKYKMYFDYDTYDYVHFRVMNINDGNILFETYYDVKTFIRYNTITDILK